MRPNISQLIPILTKFFIIFQLLCFSSFSLYQNKADIYFKYRKGEIYFNKSEKLQTYVLYSNEEKTKGLSGIKPKDFSKKNAVLFFYSKDGNRQFWMPNTYMNLDIIFLDKNFKIIALERKLKAHPSKSSPPLIEKTKPYFARYVIEIRSDSPFGKKIKIGDKLNWSSKHSLEEIRLNIRPLK